MLRTFGARIGRRVHIYPTVEIAIPWNLEVGDDTAIGNKAILYSLGRIEIQSGATISQYAHLCAGTHDYRKSDLPLVKSGIVIGTGAWVCASVFVGPGVKVGDFAIIGAASVLVSDAEAWTINAGNPSKMINRRPPIEE